MNGPHSRRLPKMERPWCRGERTSLTHLLRQPATLVVACVAAAGCSGANAGIPLPTPVSPPPVIGDRCLPNQPLRAGFAKIDITPPPGMPLGGNSLDGKIAVGYRHRLFARAMLLEDACGERLAFVVADLPHVSSLLHRRAAERLRNGPVEIGADRFFFSATHSHAAPGNHYEVTSYNDQAGARPGFDSTWTAFLVNRLDDVVRAAYIDLAPARAGWIQARIPSPVTVNRSLTALARNPSATPNALTVDDTLYLLRVDRCPTGNDCQPRGAFSIFGIHGTGNPPINDLMDGDVHAGAERALEQGIDSANGGPAWRRGFASSGVHLLANGLEGDVSPAYDPESRCSEYLEFRYGNRPGGPRTPPAPETWRLHERHRDRCLRRARLSLNQIGGTLGRHAVRTFDRAAPASRSDLRLRRAFSTVALREVTEPDSLCAPRFGTASLGGAEDGRSRLYGWRFFGFIESGFEEGPGAVAADTSRCQGAKRVGFGFLQSFAVGERGFPEHAQIAVLTIGNAMIATVPWEVTTTAGQRIKDAMRRDAPDGIDHYAVVGLTNGYLQYLTTAEEYTGQSYEAASNLYGPGTLAAVVLEVGRLAASLARDEPVVSVGPIDAYPGTSLSYFARPDAGPRPDAITRRFLDVSCEAALVTVEWLDVYPGRFIPAESQLLEFRSGDGRVVAWDDMGSVEVRAMGPLGSRGYRWQVDWHRDTGVDASIVLVEREDLPEVRAFCPAAGR